MSKKARQERIAQLKQENEKKRIEEANQRHEANKKRIEEAEKTKTMKILDTLPLATVQILGKLQELEAAKIPENLDIDIMDELQAQNRHLFLKISCRKIVIDSLTTLSLNHTDNEDIFHMLVNLQIIQDTDESKKQLIDKKIDKLCQEKLEGIGAIIALMNDMAAQKFAAKYTIFKTINTELKEDKSESQELVKTSTSSSSSSSSSSPSYESDLEEENLDDLLIKYVQNPTNEGTIARIQKLCREDESTKLQLIMTLNKEYLESKAPIDDLILEVIYDGKLLHKYFSQREAFLDKQIQRKQAPQKIEKWKIDGQTIDISDVIEVKNTMNLGKVFIKISDEYKHLCQSGLDNLSVLELSGKRKNGIKFIHNKGLVTLKTKGLGDFRLISKKIYVNEHQDMLIIFDEKINHTKLDNTPSKKSKNKLTFLTATTILEDADSTSLECDDKSGKLPEPGSLSMTFEDVDLAGNSDENADSN